MRSFFRFSLKSIVIAPIGVFTLFLSYAFAGQFEVIPVENKAMGQKILVSDGNATSHSGYSHQKGEGSASKALSPSGYSQKKTEGSGSKSYSHSKKGYSHSQAHGKHSGGYGAHGSYGHSSGHSMNNPFRHVLKFKETISLTEDQVIKIKDQKFEYEKQAIKFYAEKKIAKMELERVLHSESLDESHARNLAVQIAQLKGQMIKIRVEAKISIINLLTGEQRKK